MITAEEGTFIPPSNHFTYQTTTSSKFCLHPLPYLAHSEDKLATGAASTSQKRHCLHPSTDPCLLAREQQQEGLKAKAGVRRARVPTSPPASLFRFSHFQSRVRSVQAPAQLGRPPILALRRSRELLALTSRPRQQLPHFPCLRTQEKQGRSKRGSL